MAQDASASVDRNSMEMEMEVDKQKSKSWFNHKMRSRKCRSEGLES